MKIAGLEIKIERTAYNAFFILVLIPFFVIGVYVLIFGSPERQISTFIYALLLGVCFALYHQIAQFAHQLGHAVVAHAVGYPMTGVRYEYVFSFSEYPPNEPLLPAKTHIQRSLGGVVGITLMLLIIILLWAQVDETTTWFKRWLLNFLLFDSALLFFASAVLSDGLLFVLQKGWKEAENGKA
jgi:hypothetical protein